MERKKHEMITSMNNFKSECNSTHYLLGELEEIHACLLERVNNLNENDFYSNSKCILEARQFQYMSQQKILEINFALEKFISENVPNLNVSNLSEAPAVGSTLIDGNSFLETINSPENFDAIKKSGSVTSDIPDSLFFSDDGNSATHGEVKCEEVALPATPDRLNTSCPPSTSSEQLFLDATSSYNLDLSEKFRDCNILTKKEKFEHSSINFAMPDLSYKRPVSCASTISSGYKKDAPHKKKKLILQPAAIPEINAICMISYIKSPSEFYVQVASEDSSYLDMLSNDIAKFYSPTSSQFRSKSDLKKNIKKHCVVYCEKWDLWCRAKIENWMNDKTDLLQCKLVDYGSTMLICWEHVRSLREKFCKWPIFAVECHLAYLYPPGSTEEEQFDIWPESTVHEFRNVAENKIFKIAFAAREESSLSVDLIDSEHKGDVTLGTHLLQNNMAVEIFDNRQMRIRNPFMMDQIKTAQGVMGITSDMSVEEKFDVYFKNNQDNEPNEINEAITNYNPDDEARSCRFAHNGSCFKMNCRLDHTPLRRDGLTRDQVPVFVSALAELVLPKVGESIILNISSIQTSCEFYASMKRDVWSETIGSSLDKLVEHMNRPDIVKNYKPFKITPCLGQIVVVQHWDGRWYRGKIVEYVANPENPNSFQVFMVDYGDEIQVSLDDMKQIIKDYLMLPFQAICCYIHNIRPLPNFNITMGISYLESTYLSQEVKAKVVSTNLMSMHVLLCDQNGEDIGTKIIEQGFVLPNENDYTPAANQVYLVD